jgi:hypothetical protein
MLLSTDSLLFLLTFMDLGPICASSAFINILVYGVENQKSSKREAGAMVGKGMCSYRSRSPVVPHKLQL